MYKFPPPLKRLGTRLVSNHIIYMYMYIFTAQSALTSGIFNALSFASFKLSGLSLGAKVKCS